MRLEIFVEFFFHKFESRRFFELFEFVNEREADCLEDDDIG